jgi:hypothetical protein
MAPHTLVCQARGSTVLSNAWWTKRQRKIDVSFFLVSVLYSKTNAWNQESEQKISKTKGGGHECQNSSWIPASHLHLVTYCMTYNIYTTRVSGRCKPDVIICCDISFCPIFGWLLAVAPVRCQIYLFVQGIQEIQNQMVLSRTRK